MEVSEFSECSLYFPCFYSAFDRAKDALESGIYNDVIPLCTEEITTPDSKFMSQALLLRGTFFILSGQGPLGLEDFDKILSLENVPKEVSACFIIILLLIGCSVAFLYGAFTGVKILPTVNRICHIKLK